MERTGEFIVSFPLKILNKMFLKINTILNLLLKALLTKLKTNFHLLMLLIKSGKWCGYNMCGELQLNSKY